MIFLYHLFFMQGHVLDSLPWLEVKEGKNVTKAVALDYVT